MRRCWPLTSVLVLSAILGANAAAQTERRAYPAVRPTGRLHLDGAFYNQDRNPLSNGAEARRARLGIAGALSERVEFLLEADFADNDLMLRDAWLRYRFSPKAWFQIGNFKEPISLEQETSSNFLSFLERSLADGAFVPPRHLGMAVRLQSDPFLIMLGVFGNEVGSETGPELIESEPIGVTARGVATPLNRPRRLVHLGADLRYRLADVTDGDTLVVEFNALSETHVDRIELYNTGPISFGRRYGQAMGEAAFVYGSLSLQGEFIWTRVQRAVLGEPVFSGGYVFLSIIPTGESRSYDSEDADFNGVTTPRHKYGALELLLRYSRLDLNDLEVTGGAGHDWTIGLNWYPRAQVRVLTNYVFTNHDALATGDGLFLGDDDFGVFQFRVQYYF